MGLRGHATSPNPIGGTGEPCSHARVCSGWGRNPKLKGFSSIFWPAVLAGEANVCPSKGRDRGDNICQGALAFLFPVGCGPTEAEEVSMDNDGCKQV
jgi:hypothetical protein